MRAERSNRSVEALPGQTKYHKWGKIHWAKLCGFHPMKFFTGNFCGVFEQHHYTKFMANFRGTPENHEKRKFSSANLLPFTALFKRVDLLEHCCCYKCTSSLLLTYRTVGNFCGFNFLWFGDLRRFCGFIFS